MGDYFIMFGILMYPGYLYFRISNLKKKMKIILFMIFCLSESIIYFLSFINQYQLPIIFISVPMQLSIIQITKELELKPILQQIINISASAIILLVLVYVIV